MKSEDEIRKEVKSWTHTFFLCAAIGALLMMISLTLAWKWFAS